MLTVISDISNSEFHLGTISTVHERLKALGFSDRCGMADPGNGVHIRDSGIKIFSGIIRLLRNRSYREGTFQGRRWPGFLARTISDARAQSLKIEGPAGIRVREVTAVYAVVGTERRSGYRRKGRMLS